MPKLDRKLTRQDIRDAVGQAAYQRGVTYFEQGRVSGMQVEPRYEGDVRITATTVGSAGARYEQTVDVVTLEDTFDIEGECSCPVVFNCKHVAAVCCAWLASTTDTAARGGHQEAALTRWLDALAHASSPTPKQVDEFVVYLLDIEASTSNYRETVRIEARVVKLRAKDGQLTRGRALKLYEFDNPYRQSTSAVLQIDLDIAKLLSASEGPWAKPSFRGSMGHLALQRLLETRRCFWMSTDNPPLSMGASRALQIEWEDNGKRQALELRAEVAGGAILLPCDPPLYLDPLQHEVGPVDTLGLDHAQIELLRTAPAVPAAQAQAFAAKMAAKVPHLPVPPPATVNVREVTGQMPRPLVQLRGGRWGVETMAYLALDFCYGTDVIHGLPPAPFTLQGTAEGLVRITRNLEAEQEIQDHLATFGFVQVMQRDYVRDEPVSRLVYVASGATEFERASRWSNFLRAARDTLVDAGWEIDEDASFPLRFETGEWWADVGEDTRTDWFELSFNLQIGDTRLPLIDVLLPILAADWQALPEIISVPLGAQRYVDVPAARLRPLLDVLRGLFDRGPRDDAERMRLSRMDATLLRDLAAQGIEVRGGQRWLELAERLRDFDGIRHVPPDPGMVAELRPYQQRGLDWLQFLREYGFNGILADDMGLGKTLQTLAHLLIEKRAGRLTKPALIVAPTSLMGNWRREAARFAPALRVAVLHGHDRHDRFEQAGDLDLLLTTYPLLPRDAPRLRELSFHSVILDEAQTVKNPRAKAAQVARALETDHRLCLTGTPMENHLGELWALFDFLMPGFLGDAESFRRHYRTPIETQGDLARQESLARRVAPFMLRRTKQAVAADLPPKTEIIQRVELGPAQAELYESIRVTVDKRVRDAIAQHGLARSHITVLDALLKLRQVCCDPRLLKLEDAQRTEESAKFEMLFELLESLLAEGRKVLVFSQFTSMLALLGAELETRNLSFALLTGDTVQRDREIDRFRAGAVNLFLISLKAGGVGLNLPEADTVIHYDPWWNPAVEAQATDRAHRIGQTQPVFVYKLIVENSVEEKMLELQARKRALAAGVYAGQEGDDGPLFDAAMLSSLFEPLGSETSASY